MKRIILLAMLAMNMTAMAQNKTYTVANDPDGGSLIFNGQINFNDLDKEPTFTWLKESKEGYKPNEENVNYLRQHLNQYTMVVFMGTWCSDSHELIPKLEKLVETANYPADKITMYATDHEKKTKGGEHSKYGITLVPTVILFNNGKEAGRITESVNKSIDADLVAIIQKDQQH